jgi:hypothetical protein
LVGQERPSGVRQKYCIGFDSAVVWSLSNQSIVTSVDRHLTSNWFTDVNDPFVPTVDTDISGTLCRQ